LTVALRWHYPDQVIRVFLSLHKEGHPESFGNRRYCASAYGKAREQRKPHARRQIEGGEACAPTSFSRRTSPSCSDYFCAALGDTLPDQCPASIALQRKALKLRYSTPGGKKACGKAGA